MTTPDITVVSGEPRVLLQQLRDMGLELLGFTDAAEGFEARLAVVPWVAATGQPAARPLLVELLGPDGRPGKRLTLDECGVVIKWLTSRLGTVLEANKQRRARVAELEAELAAERAKVDKILAESAVRVSCEVSNARGDERKAWQAATDRSTPTAAKEWLDRVERSSLALGRQRDEERARANRAEAELAADRAKVAEFLSTLVRP